VRVEALHIRRVIRCGWCLAVQPDTLRRCGCVTGWVEEGETRYICLSIRVETGTPWPDRMDVWAEDQWFGVRNPNRHLRSSDFDPVAAGVVDGTEST
jgi:hypothetical protein